MDSATVFDWFYNAARWTWHDPDGYNFISGPLADITLLGGAYAIVRRHNCHAKGCWRIGRHKVAGTDYIVCRHHHPNTTTPTAEDILQAHHEAVQRGKRVAHVAEAVVHGTESAVHGAEVAVHSAAEAVHEAEEVIMSEEDDRADDHRPFEPPSSPPGPPKA